MTIAPLHRGNFNRDDLMHGEPSRAESLRSLKWDAHPGKIGAWIAESDFGTAPAVTAALQRAVEANFLTYLPASTARHAESACAWFLGQRFGWDVPDERVHLVPDVLAGLRITIAHFTQPGSAVIVPTPSYPPFLSVPRWEGREIIELPSRLVDGRWSIDLVGLDQAFASGAGLLVLCNPHNPLGQVMSADEHAGVAAVVERHGGRVFSDDIHSPILFDGRAHLPYAAHSSATAAHTVTAIATSKGWNIPGLKAAQLILTNDRDQALWMDRDIVPSQSGSILGAVAAIAAYLDGVEWLDKTVERFQANRDLLATQLQQKVPGVRMALPEATYLAWLDFSALTEGASPADRILTSAGIAASDGASCGDAGLGWIRFNFAMEPQLLRHAVDRLAAAFPS
ncbi:MAG: MalY/PatB family protein [Rhodoglobus sp.]